MAFSIVGALLFGLFALGGIITVATGETDNPDPAGDIFVIAVFIGIAASCVIFGLKASRFIQANMGTVTVVNDFLMIDVKAFFAQPLYVPLQSIRVIAVDTRGPQGWDAQTGGGMFPVYRQDLARANGGPSAAARSYYLQQSQYEAGRLFQPNNYPDWPNVAIILDQSMVINVDTRRGIFKKAVHEDVAVPGFVLRANDRYIAARVMAATGKQRDLYEVDVEHMNSLVVGNAMPLAPAQIYPVTGPGYPPQPAFTPPPAYPQQAATPYPQQSATAHPQQPHAQPAYQHPPAGYAQQATVQPVTQLAAQPAAQPVQSTAQQPGAVPGVTPVAAPGAAPGATPSATPSAAPSAAPPTQPGVVQPGPQQPTSPPPPQAAAQ